MKKLLVILYLILCHINSISAQGVVTVTQSSDIEAIVNGKKAKTKKQLKTEKKTTKEDKKTVLCASRDTFFSFSAARARYGTCANTCNTFV